MAPIAPVVVQNAATATHTPTITGTAEAGALVTVSEGAVVLGSATADGTGHWTLQSTVSLADGTHSVVAKAMDGAHNVSLTSNTDTFAIAASNNVIIDQTASGTSKTPAITGTASVGSVVTLKDGTDVLGSATTDANGYWTFAPSSALQDGSHSVVASITVNNASINSGTDAFIVYPTAPVGTTGILDTTNNNAVVTNEVTVDNSFKVYLSGATVDPGTHIEVYRDGTDIGVASYQTAIATGVAGGFSINDASVANGQHTYSFYEVAGTDSTVKTLGSQVSVNVVTATPTITAAASAHSGAVGSGGTVYGESGLTISGTSPVVLTGTSHLEVYQNGVDIGAATLNGTSWTKAVTGLSMGNTYSYTTAVIDDNGVIGKLSSAFTVTDANFQAIANNATVDWEGNGYSLGTSYSYIYHPNTCCLAWLFPCLDNSWTETISNTYINSQWVTGVKADGLSGIPIGAEVDFYANGGFIGANTYQGGSVYAQGSGVNFNVSGGTLFTANIQYGGQTYYVGHGWYYASTNSNYQTNYYSPLVLDFTGHGVQTVGMNAGVMFDLNNSGTKTNVGWIAAGQGLLCLLDANGNVTSGAQLFGQATKLADGSTASNGYEALAQYDANHDGVINSGDAIYSQLRVWIDSNGDGVETANELYTLAQLNVQSISLAYQSSSTSQNGNQIGLVGSYTTTDGLTHEAADVWFSQAAAPTTLTFDATHTNAVGSGNSHVIALDSNVQTLLTNGGHIDGGSLGNSALTLVGNTNLNLVGLATADATGNVAIKNIQALDLQQGNTTIELSANEVLALGKTDVAVFDATTGTANSTSSAGHVQFVITAANGNGASDVIKLDSVLGHTSEWADMGRMSTSVNGATQTFEVYNNLHNNVQVLIDANIHQVAYA